MRLVIITAIGIAVGVTLARWCGAAPPTEAVAPRTASGVTPVRAAGPRAAVLREAPVRQRDLAESDPRYDPLALQREQDELTAKDIWDREPRDPVVAPVFERRAAIAVALVFRELKLDGKLRGVRVECKTLSCYTFIELDDGDVNQVYDEVNGILIGDSQMPGIVHTANGKPAGVTLYNLYRPGTRDDADYRQLIDAAMRPALEFARQRFLKEP